MTAPDLMTIENLANAVWTWVIVLGYRTTTFVSSAMAEVVLFETANCWFRNPITVKVTALDSIILFDLKFSGVLATMVIDTDILWLHAWNYLLNHWQFLIYVNITKKKWSKVLKIGALSQQIPRSQFIPNGWWLPAIKYWSVRCVCPVRSRHTAVSHLQGILQYFQGDRTPLTSLISFSVSFHISSHYYIHIPLIQSLIFGETLYKTLYLLGGRFTYSSFATFMRHVLEPNKNNYLYTCWLGYVDPV